MIDYNRLYQNLNLKDKKDPRSIVNLAPSWLAKRLEVIPDEVFSLTEDELRKRVTLGVREAKLRISFWQEYYRISNSKRLVSINISNVCGGICDHRTFQSLIQNSFVLAFILMAPPEVNNSLEMLVYEGLERMNEIMRMRAIDQEGKFDKGIADMQLKIYQDAMNRRRGPVSTTSKNLHLVRHEPVNPELPTPTREVSSVAYDIESQIAHEEQLLIENTPVEIKEHAMSVEVLTDEPQEI